MKKTPTPENIRLVIPIGTSVEFGDEHQILLRGKVNAINLYKFSTTYDIMFWYGPDFKSITLREEDFCVKEKVKNKIKIGFDNE